MNKVIKAIALVIVIFFLSLYFSSYHLDYNENKRILTEEAISRFEKDLKEGKKINSNNYIVKDKNYNNKACKIGLKVSNIIEKTFKGGFHIILKYLEDN